MKKTILKTVFSTLLTGVIVTGTVFAFTNTVPYKQDNQVVSAAEWNTIKTTIDNLKNSINFANYFTKAESTNKFIDAGDLTACTNGQVAKMTATGFVCVTDQTWSSMPNLPSCTSSQYLTTQSGKFVCKALPAGSGGSSLTACPPYKVHVHDDSRNADEYLSYVRCIPWNGKVTIQLPHILDDYWDDESDERYMKNDINLAKTVCKQFGLVYQSHTSQDYSANKHIKIKNNRFIPYDQDWWNLSTILSNVTCAVGTVDTRTKFFWWTTSGSLGWGWGWSGGNPTPKYDMK